jgi:hypothetical protein
MQCICGNDHIKERLINLKNKNYQKLICRTVQLRLGERRRQWRSPNRQCIRTRYLPLHWRLRIHQIAVCIVLNLKPTRISPIVKDLRSEDVFTDAPDNFVASLLQPFMANKLSIKISHLERTMVQNCLLARRATL